MRTSASSSSIRPDKSFANTLLPGVFVFVVLCLILLIRPASGQSIQQFVGNVSDTSHAVIPGVTVTIHNEGTGEEVVVISTGSGDYTAPYLKPGVYTVTADKAGFKTVSKTHITLDVDKTSKIDFILPVGSVSETVTVSDSGRLWKKKP